MTTKNNATNGVAKTDTKEVTPTPELSKMTVSKVQPNETKKADTIQERLKKLETLNRHLEKRNLLVEGLDNVNSFVISSQSQASIRFSDATGHTFSLSTNGVIADTVEFIKQKLEAEIAHVDSLITFD